MGDSGKAQPEPRSELRSGVGLVHSTCEVVEGNETYGGKGPAREEPAREGQGPDTESGCLAAELDRVNAAAKQAAQTRFTALLHHIEEDALLRAFRRQKRQASAGVDGVTVTKYEDGLTEPRPLRTGPQVATGHSRCGESTSPKPMAVSDLSVCRR